MEAQEAASRLQTLREAIARAEKRFAPWAPPAELVAVSKTFGTEEILPFLHAGQRVFGENRVQEASDKWPALKAQFTDINLHLIGPLQTNKARDAVALFDVIETLDRDKLARVLREEMTRSGRELPCFVQVNIGEEAQKSGVAPKDVVPFVETCRRAYELDIAGLMCIPPDGVPPGPYFAHLLQLARECGLSGLSMGMSQDFEVAIGMGATQVRIGSALFGKRGTTA